MRRDVCTGCVSTVKRKVTVLHREREVFDGFHDCLRVRWRTFARGRFGRALDCRRRIGLALSPDVTRFATSEARPLVPRDLWPRTVGDMVSNVAAVEAPGLTFGRV